MVGLVMAYPRAGSVEPSRQRTRRLFCNEPARLCENPPPPTKHAKQDELTILIPSDERTSAAVGSPTIRERVQTLLRAVARTGTAGLSMPPVVHLPLPPSHGVQLAQPRIRSE
jgi:hypothetical protein